MHCKNSTLLIVSIILSYCFEVWGTTYKSNLKGIYLLQKKAVRIICKAPKLDCTTPLFLKFKLLKLEDIVKFKCFSIMFSAYRLELSKKEQHMFSFPVDSYRYNPRSGKSFKVNYVRTTKKQHCISIFGVKLHNYLPNCIATLPNIHMLKGF